MKSSQNKLIVWGYFVELLLIGVLLVIFKLAFGVSRLSDFVESTATGWAQLTGTFLAAAIGVWLTFANIRTHEFGDDLAKIGVLRVFSTAFIASMGIHLAATVLLIVAKSATNEWFRFGTLGFLCYSGLNLFTLIQNATDLLELYGTFSTELTKTRQSQKPQSD